ncbi:hypothetical protein TNCV_1130231 [Trichonephila clavipes]|nr:hypothetical protein TNCV_1130231 [Trichonephila clavipes]
MCFGLCNAASTFQRFIDDVTRALVDSTLLKHPIPGAALSIWTDASKNEFGKMEQAATDLSRLSFVEEAGHARRQQRKKKNMTTASVPPMEGVR